MSEALTGSEQTDGESGSASAELAVSSDYVHRISAVFLIVAGAYIVWFWIDDLSTDAGEQRAVTGYVDNISASLTNWIADNSTSIGVTFGGLIAISMLSIFMKRFEPAED